MAKIMISDKPYIDTLTYFTYHKLTYSKTNNFLWLLHTLVMSKLVACHDKLLVKIPSIETKMFYYAKKRGNKTNEQHF